MMSDSGSDSEDHEEPTQAPASKQSILKFSSATSSSDTATSSSSDSVRHLSESPGDDHGTSVSSK